MIDKMTYESDLKESMNRRDNCSLADIRDDVNYECIRAYDMGFSHRSRIKKYV